MIILKAWTQLFLVICRRPISQTSVAVLSPILAEIFASSIGWFKPCSSIVKLFHRPLLLLKTKILKRRPFCRWSQLFKRWWRFISLAQLTVTSHHKVTVKLLIVSIGSWRISYSGKLLADLRLPAVERCLLLLLSWRNTYCSRLLCTDPASVHRGRTWTPRLVKFTSRATFILNEQSILILTPTCLKPLKQRVCLEVELNLVWIVFLLIDLLWVKRLHHIRLNLY